MRFGPFDPPPVPADPLAGMPDELRARLPNVVVIGAGKCGTTALHQFLAAHPHISMAAAKELQLFGGPGWIEGLRTYPEHFAVAPLRGETSPSYSMDPFVPQVPEQMAAVLPDPLFVYLVGHPLRRAVAHWSEQRVLMLEKRSLEACLVDADDPYNPYVAASRYGHQLSRYVDVFGPERVLVVDQRDLRERRQQTLRTVFEFLGADPDAPLAQFAEEANAAPGKFMFNALGLRVFLWQRARGSVFLPRRFQRLFGRPIERPPLAPATEARLLHLLAPEVRRLEELTGRSFGHWEIT